MRKAFVSVNWPKLMAILEIILTKSGLSMMHLPIKDVILNVRREIDSWRYINICWNIPGRLFLRTLFYPVLCKSSETITAKQLITVTLYGVHWIRLLIEM